MTIGELLDNGTITPSDVDNLAHALGRVKSGPTYRRHFVASYGSQDFESCTRLVASGLMRAGDDMGYGQCFYVTDEGIVAYRAAEAARKEPPHAP